jgi:hypothetical protein
MAIDAANLKWYQCTTWTEGSSHGGAIDTGAQITDNTMNNIFDNVTNAERIAGMTDYRKIFFRNENSDSYTYPKGWISSQTPATNSAVWIVCTGSKSLQGSDVALSGTATFAASTSITNLSDLTTEVRPGDWVFNSTNDTYTSAQQIASMTTNSITLSSSYTGTTGSGKGISVARATAFTFYQPSTKAHTNACKPGAALAQNASFGIWVKRVIDAAGNGYNSDTFTLSVEDDTS